MRNDIFTTTLHTEYLVTSPQGQVLGTYTTWEGAQIGAQGVAETSSTGEVYIMRETDTLEIVQVDREVVDLKIAGGVCNWCQNETDVVCHDDLYMCQDCSAESGEGENVWNYLRS